MGVPRKSAAQGEVAEEEEEEEEARPPGKMEERAWKEEGEVVREGARRVNADSSTKAAAAAEGREEHGKRAKVKGTSGGFKFKATVSVCILTAAPHPPSQRLYFHSQQQALPRLLPNIKSEALIVSNTSGPHRGERYEQQGGLRFVRAGGAAMASADEPPSGFSRARQLWVSLLVKKRKCSVTCMKSGLSEEEETQGKKERNVSGFREETFS